MAVHAPMIGAGRVWSPRRWLVAGFMFVAVVVTIVMLTPRSLAVAL